MENDKYNPDGVWLCGPLLDREGGPDYKYASFNNDVPEDHLGYLNPEPEGVEDK
jgi:hypothetical protein